jgi:hypothetical protein
VLFENFMSSPRRSLIVLERDLARRSTLVLERPTKKRLGGTDMSLGAKEEIHGLAGLVHGTAEICPTPPDLPEVSSTRHDPRTGARSGSTAFRILEHGAGPSA